MLTDFRETTGQSKGRLIISSLSRYLGTKYFSDINKHFENFLFVPGLKWEFDTWRPRPTQKTQQEVTI